MEKSHLNKIINNKKIQTIFVDYFDTIAHRTVHPNHVIRLWAKLMIRELGLNMKIDELYFIRKDSLSYLAKKNNSWCIAVDYDKLIEEIYSRLDCSNKLKNIPLKKFVICCKIADYQAEIKVQYLNDTTIDFLKELKEKNYKIYCVSDFHTSKQVLKNSLAFHKIQDLFDDVFVSSQYNASKHSGNLYPILLKKLKIEAANVVMVGDNYTSDIQNAQKFGITTIHLPNKKESKTKKRYAVGSDRKDYRRILSRLYRTCNHKMAPANSDYILFYTIYIQRLYRNAKKEGIKNIFFLSREGLYLKKMFDHYQQYSALQEEGHIKSHYFKTSRQASMLVSLKAIDVEEFTFLRRKYPDLSLNGFLQNFTFSTALISSIIVELNFQEIKDEVILDFLESEVFLKLKTSEKFRNAYQTKRSEQQIAFNKYIDSFEVDFRTEGIHLADIGWGGSMQERLFDYFKGKVKVYGHYLGLNEIYDINKDTNRWGLNFSVFPYTGYSDNILRGNTELNEQLLSAPHGSTLSYTDLDTFTNEYHYEVEKQVFNEHILEIQQFMFVRFKELLKDFDCICYDDDIVQNEMTDYALRVGLFASKRKVASAMKISEGFYSNVGNFSSGLKISPKKYSKDKFKLLKTFLLGPDKLFPFLLRIKPYFYTRKKYFLAYLMPTFLIYYYIKANRSFKKTVLKGTLRFKYDYLK